MTQALRKAYIGPGGGGCSVGEGLIFASFLVLGFGEHEALGRSARA